MSTESRLENIARYEKRNSMNVSAEVYRGHVISIWYDECPESPREWSNVAVLCLDHRRYTLPWECDEVGRGDATSANELQKLLQSEADIAVILPVWGYDHSGFYLKAGDREYPFDCPWDSGLVGFAYVTREAIRRELGEAGFGQLDITMGPLRQNESLQPISAEGRKWARQMIHCEVETYGAYLSGSVYGYSILNSDGDVVDSCAGFYDKDYLMTEARAQVDGLVSDNEN